MGWISSAAQKSWARIGLKQPIKLTWSGAAHTLQMLISCFRRRCSVNVFGNTAGGASRRAARALHYSSDLGRRLELVAQRFGCLVLSLCPRTTFHIQFDPSRSDCSAATFFLNPKNVFALLGEVVALL